MEKTTTWSWPAWAIRTLAAFENDAVPVLVSDDESETTPIKNVPMREMVFQGGRS